MTTDDMKRTFARIRRMFRTCAPRALVTKDTPTAYYVASPTLRDRKGRPLLAGGVEVTKRYVSVHLIPVYVIPDLAASLSPGLKRRMQGKSCFNFTTIEPAELRELAGVTRRGLRLLEHVALPWNSRR